MRLGLCDAYASERSLNAGVMGQRPAHRLVERQRASSRLAHVNGFPLLLEGDRIGDPGGARCLSRDVWPVHRLAAAQQHERQKPPAHLNTRPQSPKPRRHVAPQEPLIRFAASVYQEPDTVS